MAGNSNDRDQTVECEHVEICALLRTFLREIDTASAYVIELDVAVLAEDRMRIVDIKANLHHTWKNAGDVIAKLERVSGQSESIGRMVLQQSQELARDALTRAWEFILASYGKT